VNRGKTLAEALARQGIDADPAAGTSTRIGELYVMLTWRCNLRCRMCPMWGRRGFCRDGVEEHEPLEVATLLAWLDAAPDLRPRTVTLSGGEPMLSTRWSPLVRALSDRGHRVALTTNGTLLTSMEDDDLDALHQINVSLDGPAFVLESLGRGGGETLDSVTRGLASVLSRRRGARPRLRLLAVVSAEGVGHLLGLLQRLDGEGIRFDDILLQHTLFIDDATATEQELELGALLPQDVPLWRAMVAPSAVVDVLRLNEEIQALRARPEPLHVSPELGTKELARYYGSGRWTPPSLAGACLAPWLDLGITPAGDVWLCPGHRAGNLFEDRLAEVWNGSAACALRRRLASEGHFPGCRGCFYFANYRGTR